MGILSKIIEILLKIEEKRIMREVSKDKDLKKTTVSDEVHDAIFDEIRRKEEQWELEKRALEQISSENKELIRLGRIYKNSLHRRKYIILAAILVLTLATSITSFGGVERMFHRLSSMICGRTRETVSTEGVKTLEEKEEEVFAELEKLYGVSPARITHLPGEAEFLEANIMKDVMEANLIYGTSEEIRVTYDIVLDYRDGSWALDVEDELIKDYVVTRDGMGIRVKEFLVNDVETRWLIQFEHKNLHYWICIVDVSQDEIQKVIESIYIPE